MEQCRDCNATPCVCKDNEALDDLLEDLKGDWTKGNLFRLMNEIVKQIKTARTNLPATNVHVFRGPPRS